MVSRRLGRGWIFLVLLVTLALSAGCGAERGPSSGGSPSAREDRAISVAQKEHNLPVPFPFCFFVTKKTLFLFPKIIVYGSYTYF